MTRSEREIKKAKKISLGDAGIRKLAELEPSLVPSVVTTREWVVYLPKLGAQPVARYRPTWELCDLRMAQDDIRTAGEACELGYQNNETGTWLTEFVYG